MENSFSTDIRDMPPGAGPVEAVGEGEATEAEMMGATCGSIGVVEVLDAGATAATTASAAGGFAISIRVGVASSSSDPIMLSSDAHAPVFSLSSVASSNAAKTEPAGCLAAGAVSSDRLDSQLRRELFFGPAEDPEPRMLLRRLLPPSAVPSGPCSRSREEEAARSSNPPPEAAKKSGLEKKTFNSLSPPPTPQIASIAPPAKAEADAGETDEAEAAALGDGEGPSSLCCCGLAPFLGCWLDSAIIASIRAVDSAWKLPSSIACGPCSSSLLRRASHPSSSAAAVRPALCWRLERISCLSCSNSLIFSAADSCLCGWDEGAFALELLSLKPPPELAPPRGCCESLRFPG
jgi:hypothetical protein